MKIKFGATYQDAITGFAGIATGTADYITGCSQVLIVPKVSETGDHREGHWVDVGRLVLLEESTVKLPNISARTAIGGDKLPSRRY